MFSHREQPDLYHGRLSQTVQLNRRSRTRHRLGVRIEESWPNSMAESMVGGTGSTQSDSTMTREELRSPNPWLSRAALRSSRKIYGLDTAFVLIDGTKKPGHVILVLYDFSNEITDAEKTNLRNFVESIKGVVVLHHAIADY